MSKKSDLQERDYAAMFDGLSANRSWNKHLCHPTSVVANPIRKAGGKFIKGERRVKVKCAGLSDVLYVSMNGNDETDNGSGCLRWNGRGVRIDDLSDWTKCKGVEGFVKDLAWQYEQETRLFVILKNEQYQAKRISTQVPDEVFEAMSIVLSPWLPENKVDSTKEQVESWFEDAGLPIPRTIRRSQLTDALGAWK